MKKITMQRLILGIIQHFCAVLISIVVAEIAFHSYMTVETLNGKTTYYLNLMSSEREFENTDEFADIFQTSVKDIMQYVVVKDQMEENASFAYNKKIDINRFGKKVSENQEAGKSIYYELDDLIKWGIYGVEYSERSMSLHDFVNYFGSVIVPENFGVSEEGTLYFKGFLEINPNLTQESNAQALMKIGEMIGDDMIQRNQLEDMAFSYIMANSGNEISLKKEEDGSYTVTIKMINNRYLSAQGKRQLYENASTWLEYFEYQKNLVYAVDTLSKNYDLYQKCNTIYDAENTNLKYTVRMITDDGVRTFSNEVGMSDLDEVDITDYFSEFHCYLIYYPENLAYMGISPIPESDIYNMIREYDYAYPESTHIWIAVDTSYSTPGDAFYHANSVFQKVIPQMGFYTFCIVFLGIAWLILALYLTVTAGSLEKNGKRSYYLNHFDRIWTEVFGALTVLFIFGCIRGARYLTQVADSVYESHFLFEANSMTKLNGFLFFGLYGLVLSMGGSLLWYSLVRRCKNASIWSDSILSLVIAKARKLFQYVMAHKNSVISSLLPYSIFLLVNLVCTVGALNLAGIPRILFLAVLGLFDVAVGFFLFRSNSEQVDIVEGIKRIRDGNVEHKLETDGLHGQNKETALAVNTIGEGIENAVRTSVKDEQMKTDLITNVSHDLKTPLTSIVNYIDLLKRLDIQDETAKSYIDVLDAKANRLKVLTDDLVEVSKITSGNIVLAMEVINLTELIKQALGEYSDLLEERNLEPVFDGREDCYIYADSRRMWRVIENLFQNVCKYGLSHTRVFIDLKCADNKITCSMKNIANHKMDVSAEDLTERFFRGDVSRTTEGSGLGLSIAKNLVQVMGGTFELSVDGDTFRTMITFHEYKQESEKSEL